MRQVVFFSAGIKLVHNGYDGGNTIIDTYTGVVLDCFTAKNLTSAIAFVNNEYGVYVL